LGRQKRVYDFVQVTLNPVVAQLNRPVEYVINYGGTCEPGYVLDHSEIWLNSESDDRANIHEYQSQINYINLPAQHFGSGGTQNFKARDACNVALQQRLSQGQTLAQALQSGFTLWQVHFHDVSHRLHCRRQSRNQMETSLASAPIRFDVVCGGTTFPPPQRDPRPPSPITAPRPDDLLHPFAVGAVSLAATQPNFQGGCPQEVTFQGTIRVHLQVGPPKERRRP